MFKFPSILALVTTHPAVSEGFVCPLAFCDVRSPDWLVPNTFYARGVMFQTGSNFSTSLNCGTNMEIWINRHKSTFACGGPSFCTSITGPNKSRRSVCRSCFRSIPQCRSWFRFTMLQCAFRSHLSMVREVAVFMS